MASMNTAVPQTAAQQATVRVNLEDLRSRLVGRLAALTVVVAQLVILFYESPTPFPYGMLFFWSLLTAVGLASFLLAGDRPRLARHVLVWGQTAALLAAMWLFPPVWLPFTAVLLLFGHAMLVRGSEVVGGTAVLLVAWWLHAQGVRVYLLDGLVVNVLLAMVTAWLGVGSQQMALTWLWHMHQRAEELLNANRSQKAELHGLVKSLQITNELRQKAEQALLVASKEARAAQQQKEQFAANISHELRTPLSIILGFSEMMYLSPELYADTAVSLPPKLVRDIGQIYRNSRHLLAMIDDILDLSHFEMAGFTMRKEPTPMTPLLHEAVDLVADLFAQQTVTLVVDIAPDLPELNVDRTRLRQVVLNLLNNARRFTEAGTVRLTAVYANDELLVRVSDTGPGIAPDQLDNIFTEFYQVDYSLSRKHGGAGLGLAICQHFIDAHDGRIWVESEPGQGATFTFALPDDRQTKTGRLYRNRPFEPEAAAAHPSLLVLSADTAVTGMLARRLNGFEVVAVAEAAELATAVARHQPAGVVWNVPPGEQPDRELVRALPVPVLVCSLPSQSWLARELGVAACLGKPLDFGHLERILAELDGVTDILIVDDSVGMCQLVERGLSGAERPYRLWVAYDGEAGLEAMRRQPPDVVILDLIMPKMDGFAVQAAMQRDPALAKVGVILLTATNYPQDVLQQQGSQITLYQPGKLRPLEVISSIPGLLQAFKPHYDESWPDVVSSATP